MVKISIIIPVFNVEKYIAECLESVINQSLNEIEIICVDDGSTDNSNAILRKYAAIDDRIIVIEKCNGGLSSARNAGVKISHGEYIQFLDSDDFLDCNACEILYEQAKKNDLDILYFGAKAFYESEELHEKNRDKDTLYLRSRSYDAIFKGSKLFAELINNNDYVESACLQLIRKGLLDDSSWFYEGIYHEDVVFTCKTILRAQKASCIHNQFYQRRIRENSITTQNIDSKKMYSHFICFKCVLLELADTALKDNERNAICELLGRLRWRIGDDYYRLPEKERGSFLKYAPTKENYYIYNNLILPAIKESEARVELMNAQNECYRISNSLSCKLGFAMTFIPRKIRKIWRQIRK